jgi:hypothetical protein
VVGAVETRRLEASGERRQLALAFVEFDTFGCELLAFVRIQPLDAPQPDESI